MISKVVLYKGRRGCGKTLTMVKDGYKYYCAGFKIRRNFKCSFGEYITDEEILNLNKSSDIEDCVIMMDEVQIFFDSRRSMRKESLNFSNFIQQIRKRNIILLGTTQYANTIDLRFRQHTDILCYPTFIKELNICEAVYLDLTSVEDDMFHANKEPVIAKMIYNAIPVFKLYQTNEMII